MDNPQTSIPFRSGYVAIIGQPNVGKSTLLNSLIENKLSIVTPKPQTTRQSILGIHNGPYHQMIFLDTPGWLEPRDPYQKYMRRAINKSLYDDAEIILFLLEPTLMSDSELSIIRTLQTLSKPLILGVNKIDLIKEPDYLSQIKTQFQEIFKEKHPIRFFSAKTRVGLKDLKETLLSHLPVGCAYYPPDQLTDRWERFYVTELIREKIFFHFQEEIPHACAVVVEEFREKKVEKTFIRVIIYVENEGQKRILIGEKGRKIRLLGQQARQEIEKRFDREIYLELNVKIKKNWRKNPEFVKTLHEGYD